MTDKEQIKELTDFIFDYTKPAVLGASDWHKVADGELPEEDKDYLVMLEGNNYNILRYCPYNMEDNDDNALNLQKGFNAFDKEMFEYYTIDRVVAWTELPEYKE